MWILETAVHCSKPLLQCLFSQNSMVNAAILSKQYGHTALLSKQHGQHSYALKTAWTASKSIYSNGFKCCSL